MSAIHAGELVLGIGREAFWIYSMQSAFTAGKERRKS